MERIKEIEKAWDDYIPGRTTPPDCYCHFMLKAFREMRKIAAENYYDNWKFGDESKERKEAFVIVDQALEERMENDCA